MRHQRQEGGAVPRKDRSEERIVARESFLTTKWAVTGLFFVHFRLFKQTLHFTTNKCEKMSIQYMVLGFEPTAFGA